MQRRLHTDFMHGVHNAAYEIHGGMVMDKTLEYVEMCKSAREIQAQWDQYTANVGDTCARLRQNGGGYEPMIFVCTSSEWIIWLPRQDQLQDMIWNDYADIAKQYHLAAFGRFASVVWDNTGVFTSMEQLWLAFVMHNNYGKVWTGAEWVRE